MAYFDAAFADDHQCKSTAGWVLYMHGSLIGYDTSTIKRVVRSSTEAECNAMAIIGTENTWQRRVYSELMGIKGTLPPTLVYGDNAASLLMLDSGVTKRSRHFAIEWFKVKELVDEKELEVKWVAGEDNLADFFTKKLPRQRFTKLRNLVMGCDEEPTIARCLTDFTCNCHIKQTSPLFQFEVSPFTMMGDDVDRTFPFLLDDEPEDIKLEPVPMDCDANEPFVFMARIGSEEENAAPPDTSDSRGSTRA